MTRFAPLVRPWIIPRMVLWSQELLGLLKGHTRLQLEQLNPLKS